MKASLGLQGASPSIQEGCTPTAPTPFPYLFFLPWLTRSSTGTLLCPPLLFTMPQAHADTQIPNRGIEHVANTSCCKRKGETLIPSWQCLPDDAPINPHPCSSGFISLTSLDHFFFPYCSSSRFTCSQCFKVSVR